MVVGSLLRLAPDRSQSWIHITVVVALLVALFVAALAVVDSTLLAGNGLDSGHIVAPFRWVPIDPADG